MTLPVGIETVTVTINAPLYPNGDLRQGRVKFTPDAKSLTYDGEDLIAGPRVVLFDGIDATAQTIELVATDAADVIPTDFTYQVAERWSDSPARTYSISLPAASPAVDLAGVAPTSPAFGELPTLGAYGQSLLGAGSAPAARAVLGLGSAATQDSSTFMPHPDLISGLRLPLHIAHRGGAMRYPEHSWEGYRAAAAGGFPVEAGDVQVLSDGTLVCIHDATVDRTMTGTGTVASLTRAQWEALNVKQTSPAADLGAGRGSPTYFTDVLDEFGGRVLLFPEIKAVAAQDGVIAAILARGLERAVVVSSNTYSIAQAVATAGIPAMLISDTVGTGGANPTAAAMMAAGVEWLCCSNAVSPAYVQAAKSAGLMVIVYPANTRAGAATVFDTYGADGIFTDDPWHTSGRYVTSDTDPWAAKRWWPGSNNVLNSQRPTYFRSDMVGKDVAAGVMCGWNHNWAGFRSSTGRIRIAARVHFLPSANTDLTRWVSLAVGTWGVDTTYLNTTGQPAYHLLFRRSGTFDIFTRDLAGTATLLATGSTGASIANTAEGYWDVEVTIDATNVTMKNLTTGVSVTIADTTFRTAFQLASTISGTHGYLSRMSVTDLP